MQTSFNEWKERIKVVEEANFIYKKNQIPLPSHTEVSKKPIYKSQTEWHRGLSWCTWLALHEADAVNRFHWDCAVIHGLMGSATWQFVKAHNRRILLALHLGHQITAITSDYMHLSTLRNYFFQKHQCMSWNLFQYAAVCTTFRFGLSHVFSFF